MKKKTLVRMGSRTGYLPLGDGGPFERPDDHDDDAENIELRPLSGSDKTLFMFTFISHLAFCCSINVVAFRDITSGTISCALIIDFFFLYFFYYGWQLKGFPPLPEHRFMNIRYYFIVHAFMLLFCFWVSITSLVLIELAKQGFFTTLSQLGPLQIALAISLLIIIFVVVVLYVGTLYLFTTLMSSFDEISSLFLAAKMQKSVT